MENVKFDAYLDLQVFRLSHKELLNPGGLAGLLAEDIDSVSRSLSYLSKEGLLDVTNPSFGGLYDDNRVGGLIGLDEGFIAKARNKAFSRDEEQSGDQYLRPIVDSCLRWLLTQNPDRLGQYGFPNVSSSHGLQFAVLSDEWVTKFLRPLDSFPEQTRTLVKQKLRLIAPVFGVGAAANAEISAGCLATFAEAETQELFVPSEAMRYKLLETAKFVLAPQNLVEKGDTCGFRNPYADAGRWKREFDKDEQEERDPGTTGRMLSALLHAAKSRKSGLVLKLETVRKTLNFIEVCNPRLLDSVSSQWACMQKPLPLFLHGLVGYHHGKRWLGDQELAEKTIEWLRELKSFQSKSHGFCGFKASKGEQPSIELTAAVVIALLDDWALSLSFRQLEDLGLLKMLADARDYLLPLKGGRDKPLTEAHPTIIVMWALSLLLLGVHPCNAMILRGVTSSSGKGMVENLLSRANRIRKGERGDYPSLLCNWNESVEVTDHVCWLLMAIRKEIIKSQEKPKENVWDRMDEFLPFHKAPRSRDLSPRI